MIDFHCHLDLYPSPHEIVRGCVERKIYVLSVTTTPAAWHGTAHLADGAARVRTALGFHPQVVGDRQAELPLFMKLLPSARYVGEIGLDGSPEHRASWSAQIRIFEDILDACRKDGGRVMSIHSRRAATPVLDRIERANGGTAVLHWFTGNLRELSRAIALDCWFSVGPAMLTTAKGRELALKIPRNRVLTETDGPFAMFGNRSILPWEATHAAAILANLWRATSSEVEVTLLDNLRTLTNKAGHSTDRS